MDPYTQVMSEPGREKLAYVHQRRKELMDLAKSLEIPRNSKVILENELFRLEAIENALMCRYGTLGRSYRKPSKAMLDEVAFETERMYRTRYPRLEDVRDQALHVAATGNLPKEDLSVSLAVEAALRAQTEQG